MAACNVARGSRIPPRRDRLCEAAAMTLAAPQDLEGKDIVVTGATGALGVAVVQTLLARGARCHLPMVEPAVPAHVGWAPHARAHAAPAISLDDEGAVAGFYAGLPALWASIHLVGGFAMAPIAETSLADFQKMLALNAVTCFLCSREAVRAIRRSGAGGGRIVNVAARPVVAPVGGMSAYAPSKAAVASLTQTLAAELVAEQILVNAVLPSLIDSAANRAAMPAADHASWPKAEEIAATIAFLVSPQNALTSGALVPVYGRA
jgi:NAD(P)-dependent dehydrogenase (short-subunit alcohol dehydrogenase family)